MAVTHPVAIRNAVADLVVGTALDAGGPARLALRIAGTADAPGTTAALLTMSPTSFGAAASGVKTAAAITSDTNATGNATAVSTGTLQTGAGVVRVHFTVAASGADGNLTGGLTINAGDTVSCSSLTYTAPL